MKAKESAGKNLADFLFSLQGAGDDGADVVAAKAVGVGDHIFGGGREGGHLRGEGERLGLAESLRRQGRLLVDVGLGLDLLVDVGLGLHLLVDVGEDLGGGHGGAEQSEEDLNTGENKRFMVAWRESFLVTKGLLHEILGVFLPRKLKSLMIGLSRIFTLYMK